MKRLLKKTLTSVMLIIVLFNLIIGTNVSHAFEAEEFINKVSNAIGGIVSIMFWPLRIKIVGYSFIIGELVVTSIAAADGADTWFVTPYDIFFNKIELTNVNFFEAADTTKTIGMLRENVSTWYFNIRLIALAIIAVIGVYVGIRMALSTLAEEKAKYSKMLTDFVMSIGLLFVMQYIILFIIELNNSLVKILEAAMKGLDGTTIDIGNVMWDIAWNAMVGIGINSITSALVYAGIIILTFCFLLAYINRMLKVAFLIIISPLITITYSIDKMKDSKSQALDTWLKELAYTILIQPFHCLIYMSYITICLGFLQSGNSYAGWGDILGGDYNKLVNGVLAILCLLFIKQGEKIVRKIFGFKDDDEKTSFAAGLAKTTMMMKAIPQAGTAARNFAGKAGETFQNFKKIGGEGKVFASKAGTAIAASKFGQAIKGFGDKTGINDAAKKVKDSAALKNMQNQISKANLALTNAGKQTRKMISGVKNVTSAPRRFVGKTLDKLDKVAMNNGNSRLKRFAAAKTRNAISSLSKANSSSAAIGAIAGMGSLVKDDKIGNAMAMSSAASKAVDNYKAGSTAQAIDNMKSSERFREYDSGIEDAHAEVTSDEEKIENDFEVAKQETVKARNDYKTNKTPQNLEKYKLALDRERTARLALASKRRHRYDDKDKLDAKKHDKGSTKEMFSNLSSRGKNGDFKKGSKAEKKITEQTRTTFKGVLQSEVNNGVISQADADDLSKRFEKALSSIHSEIDQKTGLLKEFDSAAVDSLVQSKIAPILAQIPAFSGVASREADIIGKSIQSYRAHRDDGYLYSELAKFQAGGGTIDNLVDRMYDEYE